MTGEVKVILIGGTSHVGKSTLAEALASRLGWQQMSTDSLSRHPGRPWHSENQVPPDVQGHYLSHTAEELVDEVLQHYRDNVWPMAKALIQTRISNPYDACLVLEGSAIWPDSVVDAGFGRTVSVWLTASEDTITGRIRNSSDYLQQPARSRLMIDRFLGRSLLYDERMTQAVNRLEQRCIDISESGTANQLLDELEGELQCP